MKKLEDLDTKDKDKKNQDDDVPLELYMNQYDVDCQVVRIALSLKGKTKGIVYHEGFMTVGAKEVIHPKL